VAVPGRRYTEVANNVQMQETIMTIQFVLLDSSPLKFAILAHCQEWQNKFTGLLYEIATNRLAEVNNYLNAMKDKYVVGNGIEYRTPCSVLFTDELHRCIGLPTLFG